MGQVVQGITNTLIPGAAAGQDAAASFGGYVGQSPDEINYVKQLQALSSGKQQDPAIQQALAQGTAQAQALAASQRGVNPALAARLAAQSQAQMQQNAGALGAQDQRAMLGQLGGELQSIRTGQIQQQGNALNANSAATQAQGSLVGGLFQGAGAMLAPKGKALGGEIDGAAPVPGDSPKNDVVPAMLSPGEIVLPRSVTQGPDASEKAKEFVEAIKAHKGKKKGEAPSFAEVVAKHRELGEVLAKCMGGKV